MYPGGNQWDEENRKDEKVRKASELARQYYPKLKEIENYDKADDQKIEKLLGVIRQIDGLLAHKDEGYRSNFYWSNRVHEDCSFNINVYFEAANFYLRRRKFKDAEKYAELARKLAFKSVADNDQRKAQDEILPLLGRIGRAQWESSDEGMASARAKDSLDRAKSICGRLYYILVGVYIVWSINAVFYAWGSKTGSRMVFITFVYLLAIAAMSFAYRMSNEPFAPQPVYTSPIVFMIFSVIGYIMRGTYKNTGFIFYILRQFGLVAFAIAGAFIGSYLLTRYYERDIRS